jgi:hypothetical protein
MLKKCVLLFALSTLLPIVGFAQERGWTTLTAKGAYDIRYDQYDKQAVLVFNNEVLMSCELDPQFPDDNKVIVSPPSPLKKYVVVMCWDRGGKEAYVIDTRNHRVVSRDIVPKHWLIIEWVSWSPDERFALVAAGGEITMGDMAFVDLVSGKVQEIEYKNLANDRGLDPRKTRYDRLQDFDPDKVSWLSPSSLRLTMDVRCNPYELGEGCYEKVISSHPVRVNLNPFSINYSSVGVAGNPRIKSRVTARGSSPYTCSFCGVWKAVVGGRLTARRATDQAGKSGNPYCGCDYLRITKAGAGKFKLNIGSEYEGKITWSDEGTVINNADAIYLRLMDGKLTGRFVSPNFYATHGMDFTYKLTCELKNDNELVFSVWCSIRGGETERAIYRKVGE